MIILKDIFNAAKAKLVADGNFQHVAYWNSQPENEEQENAYRRPAAFIEPQSEEVQAHIQAISRYSRQDTALIRVVVHVEVESYADVDSSFLECCDLIQSVRKSLNGLTADNFTPLRFDGFEADNLHTNKIVWQISFITQATIAGDGLGFEEIEAGDLGLEVEKELQIANYNIRTDEQGNL